MISLSELLHNNMNHNFDVSYVIHAVFIEKKI